MTSRCCNITSAEKTAYIIETSKIVSPHKVVILVPNQVSIIRVLSYDVFVIVQAKVVYDVILL